MFACAALAAAASGHMRRCGKPRRLERQASGRAIQLTIGIAGSTQPNPATT
jgi:hypothetical protein